MTQSPEQHADANTKRIQNLEDVNALNLDVKLLAQAMEDHCRTQNGTQNRTVERLDDIQTTQKALETKMGDMAARLINDRAGAALELSGFKREVDTKLTKRPSWATLWIFAALVSVVSIQTTIIIFLINFKTG